MDPIHRFQLLLNHHQLRLHEYVLRNNEHEFPSTQQTQHQPCFQVHQMQLKHLLVGTRHNLQMNVDLKPYSFDLGDLSVYMKQVQFHYQLVYNFEQLCLHLNVTHHKSMKLYQLLYSELFDSSQLMAHQFQRQVQIHLGQQVSNSHKLVLFSMQTLFQHYS